MRMSWFRTWKEYDLDELKKSLLIVGDSAADCASCKCLGLSYQSVQTCPECGVTFKYISSRSSRGNSPERYRWVRRIKGKRPDLVFIDFDDYKKWTGRSQAYELLGGEEPD